MYLPDINVWLALVFEAHVHHDRAKQWFNEIADDTCFVCRITQSGLLRLATNPVVFRDDTMTLAEAWSTYDLLLSDPRVAYSAEPLGLEHLWRS